MMEHDTSFTEVDLKQDEFENVRDEGPKFHCDLCDKGMVHSIALVLLDGLSTACVDSTTGDIFKSPGTVAADIRKEMLAFLDEKTQSFIAESVILEGRPDEEISDLPSDLISDFIEEFTGLKRNFLSRVSGWLLSETREDKVDDFVQEMELNSFWLLDRREAIAQTLLKNVDFKNEFHCNEKFKTEVELEHHCLQCGFRTLLCGNEGCSATFSAAHAEKHDSICPFKILPCEQKCPEILLRRDMDKHCITVCPMKPVNCPFYSIGCKATIPSSNLKQHFLEDVHSHLLFALMYLHKETSTEDLAPSAEKILQESAGRLSGTQGVRSFTNAVKDLDSKLGRLEVTKKDFIDTSGPESGKSSAEHTKTSILVEPPGLSTNSSGTSSPSEKNSDMGDSLLHDTNESKEDATTAKSDDLMTPAVKTIECISKAEDSNKSQLEDSEINISGTSPTEEQSKSDFDHVPVAVRELVLDDPPTEDVKDSEDPSAEEGKISDSREPHAVDMN